MDSLAAPVVKWEMVKRAANEMRGVRGGLGNVINSSCVWEGSRNCQDVAPWS